MADIQFEHIDPYVEGLGGDTGLTSRQKLRRNFEKIKAWMDSVVSSLASFFLRKDQADSAHEKITFEKGADFGTFSEGSTGASLWQDGDGNWHCEADFLHARKKMTAKELQIEEVTHIGGAQLLTAASMKCDFVVDKATHWRCFFLKTDGNRQVTNKWKINDQAYVNTFNLTGNHFLWRLVTGTSNTTPDASTYVVGDETYDASKYHYIDLSKSSCASDSDAPQAGDHIVQLGYQGTDSANADRKNAIMLAGAGTGSPYIREYTGINSFTLPSPETQLKPGANKFSGEVNMKAGSTLGGVNLLNTLNNLSNGVTSAATAAQKAEDDAQSAADAAQNAADTANSRIDALSTGNENLLRNSGFTGDFIDETVESGTEVDTGTEIFSSSLAHWDGTNCTVVETTASVTGKAVSLDGGSLQQTLDDTLQAGKNYIFSFKGRGTQLTFTAGGHTETVVLSGTLERYNVKFTATSASRLFTIKNATCLLMELQLICGNVPNSDWINSPKDNDKTLAYWQNYSYLADAILNASTSVLGGLIMSQMIKVGNYRNGTMTQETGGMSGLHVDGNSPFLWGGGSLQKAFYTIAKYAENPLYEASEEEVKNLMAQFVVTHGGRTILNDIIARGFIIATSGIFKNIHSPNGNFHIDELGNMMCRNAKISGSMFTPLTIINEDNFDYYVDSLDIESDATNYFTWRSGGTSDSNRSKATVSTDAETGDISVTINNNSSGGRFGMLVSGLPVGIYKIEFDVSQELLGGSFYTNYSNSTDGTGVAYTAEGSSIALAHHYVDGHYYLYIEKKTSGTFYIAYAVASQSPNAVGTVINITNFRVTKRKQGRSFGQYDNYTINLSRTGLNVQLDYMPADAVIDLPHDDAFVGAHFRLYNNTFAEAFYAHFVCRIWYDEANVYTFERTHILGHAYAGNYVELLCFDDTMVEEGSTEWRQKWVEIAHAGNEPQYSPTETNN